MSIFVEDPRAPSSMQHAVLGTGTSVVVTYHAVSALQYVFARWSVAGSAASASGDDSVV